jgi:PD-(D/E)XK nuclease superfamily
MVYSHTQISQYLRCPRSYRYRYFGRLARKGDTSRDGLRPLLRESA